MGECEILALLGAGGMGEVYRARDNSLGREVAVKVLPGDTTHHSDRLRRFEQDARADASLNHPNIMAVYSFGTTDEGIPYVIAELLQGQNVRERIAQGPIPPRKAIDYALQTARGLAAAHERGIVHRDLKPDNLFITRDGLVKILDFGLAKLVADDAQDPQKTVTLGATEPGMVLGTIGYMSPEQVRAQNTDARSDIFSLGAILYEMLSGNRAFQAATTADTMSAILKDEPADLSSRVRNLSPALARIIHRCLEKDPTERFQSARDLAFNLELLSRDDSGSGVSRSAVASAAKPNFFFPIILGALVFLAAGFGLARWLRPAAVEHRPVELRRLTDFTGMEESPALSPDGKSVAFVADQGGQRQIWVRLLAGGAPLQITHDNADHQVPRWTADSASLLYFTPSTSAGNQGQIWQIPALGGAARPLVESLAGADVSHDGHSIGYFRANQGQIELTVAGLDGANPRVAAKLPPDYLYSNLRWSPDDKWLGYQGGRTFDFDIFYVPAAGGAPQRATEDGNPLGGFAWLADSSGVVYSSSRSETLLYLPTMNLWEVRLGGKDLQQLTFGETSYMSPDIDSIGNITASRLRAQFDIWKFPVDGSPVDNVRKAVQITHQTGNVQTPSAAPGDRELVYLSDSGGHGNLWVLDLTSGQTRQITFEHDPEVVLGVPVWSPDGKYIAYARRGHTGWNVDQWMVKPDGTGARRVSEGGGWAAWSADAKWLYLSPPTPKGFVIQKMFPDGSNVMPVRDQGQKPSVAADGTLYYIMNRTGQNGASDMEIYAAEPEGAEARLVTRIPGSRLASWMLMQPVLSPDGKNLAVLLPDGPVTNLWAQPVDGGPLRQITDFGAQATFIARRVSWSTDGHSIYAAVGRGESDIVLLSNLLR